MGRLLLGSELLEWLLLDRLRYTPDRLLFSSLLHNKHLLDALLLDSELLERLLLDRLRHTPDRLLLGLLLDRVRHAPDRAAQA